MFLEFMDDVTDLETVFVIKAVSKFTIFSVAGMIEFAVDMIV